MFIVSLEMNTGLRLNRKIVTATSSKPRIKIAARDLPQLGVGSIPSVCAKTANRMQINPSVRHRAGMIFFEMGACCMIWILIELDSLPLKMVVKLVNPILREA